MVLPSDDKKRSFRRNDLGGGVMKQKKKFPIFYLTMMTIFTFLPIVITVVYSFNASKLASVWGGFSLKWYYILFRDKAMFTALKNSIIVGAMACVFAILIATPAAIAMAKVNYRSNRIISYFSSLPIMIPEIILGMVYLAVFSLLGLPFGFWTIAIGHTAFCVPYIFMMVSARLEGMDPFLEEAARDLGAGSWNVFWDITLPTILPGLLSGVLLSFAMSFDDVVISIFVTGASVTTLPIKIYTAMKTGVTPEINALAVLMICITVTIILFSAKMRKTGEEIG